MHEKPSFKGANRCLIPFCGWYEWQRTGDEKIPYFHYSSAHYFGGLYNEIGCLILTRSSTEAIRDIHHRQPVLLSEIDADSFLHGENIFDSSANYNVKSHRISIAVNDPRNNDESLIDRVEN